MNAFRSTATLALALSLSGCVETVNSDQVSVDSVYQSYQVDYQEGTHRLSSRTSFNVGGAWGTSLRLQAPSKVSMDGTRLEERSFLGTTYEASWNLPFSAFHQWVWIDQNGTSHTNSTSIVPFALENPVRDWSLSNSTLLSVSGPALSSQDTIHVTLSQQQQSGATLSILTHSQVVDATHVRVSFPTGSNIQIGTAEASISRVRYSGLQESTREGGSLTATYTSTPLTIQITP